MKILVTGANSFLAKNTIPELIDKGYQVVGILRKSKKAKLPIHINLELLETDFIDFESLETKFKECDIIIHIAAETRQSIINYSEYDKTNYVLTEKLIQLAIKNGLKKFIYVSTANTFGFGSTNNLGNEEKKIKKPFSRSFYAISKLKAQNLVLSKAKEIDVITVNPSFMIGPYDSKPSSNKIILLGYNKKIVLYPPGGKNFVDVKDVAKGIIGAINNGKSGESYLLVGENLSYKAFFQKLAHISNFKTKFIKIPMRIILFVGIIGNFLKFLKIRNSFTLTNMKILCENNYYSNLKAKRDLDISFKSIDTAIIEACNWFKKNNLLN